MMSLVKPDKKDSAKDVKPVADAISEMRSQMCLKKPKDEDCIKFMTEFCAEGTGAGAGSETCKKFFPPETTTTTTTTTTTEKYEGSDSDLVDDGLPSQGFS